MANKQGEQGTGKHPHKDTAAQHQQHDGGGGHKRRADQAHAGSKPGQGQSHSSGGESENLKEREYRDAQGNVHHHTKTYMDQHGKK